MYPPFYRDPQCAKDYSILADEGDGFRELLQVKGNYQRHRRHTLDAPVRASKLRVVVHTTNGDPSAAIYEIRCYS
ncbi:hypothetical protein D3C75_1210810 [compost metagenome]